MLLSRGWPSDRVAVGLGDGGRPPSPPSPPPLQQPPRPQDFGLSKSGIENGVGSHSIDAAELSDVSDALCQRISDLTAFKNQVEFSSGHKDYADQVPDVSLPVNQRQLNGGSNENVISTSPPQKLSSSLLNLSPKECEQESRAEYFNSESKKIDSRSYQRDSKIHQGKNSFHSREEEVERLQNKLSAAPFWDGFGRSATAKRWSAEATETMVRVGEFSPANPDLQAPGKALLGLGEYEERRRQLLDKKKQEYKDYLAQPRNRLQRTDHLDQPLGRSGLDGSSQLLYLPSNSGDTDRLSNAVDAATQTDSWLIENSHKEAPGHVGQSTLSVVDSSLQPLSPREKLNMELRHHCAPCFVPRPHASQTTEQLPDARLRQLQLQEELRLQIEEKRRLEVERREQEKKEEEALQRRVAEQQARLQAEYERDEKLRREREIQKQQQIEDFQKRQEELRAESEALKQEERRQKLGAPDPYCLRHSSEGAKGAVNAHLAPPSEPAPVSILRGSSPPLRSPRRTVARPLSPPSPRALIRVLEGPTLPKQGARLEDSLPIPLMPVAHPRSTRRSPHVSPRRSPRTSPHRSPSRFVTEPFPALAHTVSPSHHQNAVSREPSEAMRNLEERWKVPAVQKNVCTRGTSNVQDGTGNVLTQLGAFRRQLQMEHMRMEEKVRERHQPRSYQRNAYQQNISPTHYT